MTVTPHAAPRHAHARALDAAMRRLRTCYDRFAGEVAVALADTLVARGAICFTDTAGSVTPRGAVCLQTSVSNSVFRRAVTPCVDPLSPLLPLALLALTGLYMFVLPYAAKRRGV
jgi:hypothetical protein